MNINDKAGSSYWDKNWLDSSFPRPFDHKDLSLDNYVNHEFNRYFQKILKNKQELSVLEIGCANSVWLLYFYQCFNFKVYGLDYSEVGCEKGRALLKHYNVPGEVYCADLFAPPTELLGKFDLVVSFGVVEHFENTAECLKSCAGFVKPGGMLLTFIPNMTSVIGLIQKHIDRAVYDVHVPLTKEMFTLAHHNAGLTLESCDYFMSINLNVVNSGIFSSHPFNRFLRHMLSVPSKICWILEKYGIKIPRNRFTSPFLVALAKV